MTDRSPTADRSEGAADGGVAHAGAAGGDVPTGATSAGAGGDGRAGADDVRLAPLIALLRSRLGPACRDWDAAEFNTLVEGMARRQLRWKDDGHGV